ncbi:MAG: beta-galactosidase [Acidobacteria bacterium]|nr:beta-galactosidase [Acidobacteriota bacterium]
MPIRLPVLLCLAAALPGAEIQRWDAARIAPSQDYFRRAAHPVRVDAPSQTRAWLIVEYLDRGYAWINASGGRPLWGTARLNTGRVRRAVFAYDRLPREIRIEGIEQLSSLRLTDSAPDPEPEPDVSPAVALRSPMQLVTTAGADAASPEQLPEALATMRQLLPLARALGFNAIESYVKWNFVERSPGVFDWSYYDMIVAEIEKHGLQWFPLLIVGSAYTLPPWYHDSPDNIGFECLEHRQRNDIQSIFAGRQDPYVRRFLAEFGKHYARRGVLMGVRLGPSGNYGEAQYPARGNWGYRGQPIHTHIGYWAADRFAVLSFRNWLRARYPTVEALAQAWDERVTSFDSVTTFLPVTAASRRKRIDFSDWYMEAMSEWCAKWAGWAREAMPETVIHQSSGGWGPIEIGTDYSFQARGMARLKGGIRLTNESDNYPQNFAITRMASSAARYYGAALGYEPGGFGSARGVAARLFNTLTNGGVHLFYYHSNLYANDQAIGTWLAHAPLLDRRAKPVTEIAAFCPDTAIKLDDEAIRYLWASAFLTRAEAMRSTCDFDYVSEQMIDDGALARHKVLIFLWGHVTEKRILDRIARWVDEGGVLIYPERPRGLLETVEGDLSVSRRWQRGETGKGRVIFFAGDPEPGEPYARFVRDELRRETRLSLALRRALALEKPREVNWSVLENGMTALLNFGDDEAAVRTASGRTLSLKPYSIRLE